jgi:hypothetical protein
MVNPYFCYVLSFAVALLLYPLGWSDLYPPLSLSLLIFLLSTIVLHTLAGLKFARDGVAAFRSLPEPALKIAPVYVTIFLYTLWVAEFIYAGGVPLLHIILKHKYDYKLFGIPTLHVFIVTFSSFYTIFLFHRWLSGRSSYLLALYLVNLAAALLIYNRGMFLFNLSASVFLFLTMKGRFSPKHIAVGIMAAVAVSFLFGVMGNQRVSNESRIPYTNNDFLTTGHATDAFRSSLVPGEFFWAYVYATSPLANLELNVRAEPYEDGVRWSFIKWLNNEILFDFISKRLNVFTGAERPSILTVPGPFNAVTVYSGSFGYLRWVGLLLMGSVILLIPLVYVKILPAESPFYLSGLAILNTIFFFMVFDNTIRFTGLSFQMVYPIILHVCVSRFEWLKKIFL